MLEVQKLAESLVACYDSYVTLDKCLLWSVIESPLLSVLASFALM